MERLGASLLLILLVAPAAAIEDPAGDVFASIGGAAVDAPYMDLRNVTATVVEDALHLRMETEAAVSSAPPGMELNFIFVIDLDGEEGGQVYGEHDLSILCTRNTTSGSFGCHDAQSDPDQAHLVVAAGLDGNQITATVRLQGPEDGVAVAGGSSRTQHGDIDAQDFTDNALPYNSRPADGPLVGENDAPPEKDGPQPFLWVLAAAASLLVGWLVVRAIRR